MLCTGQVLLAVGLAASVPASERPRFALPITDLARASDVVVVGSVAVQRQVGSTLFLVLQPRRVLKGSLNHWLDDWASLIVSWEAPAAPDGVLDCPYGIWFLNHDDSRPWRWSVRAVTR